MKKILIGLIILFLAGNAIALTSLEKTSEEKGTRAIDRFFCSGEYIEDWDFENNELYTYYNGDTLTEAGGNCTATPRLFYWEEQNLETINLPSPGMENFLSGMTFPNAERFGYWIESTFNWDFEGDQCYTETYSPRHIVGQQEPAYVNGEDWSYVKSIFMGNGDYLGTVHWHLPIENINRPLISVATDKNNYVLAEGEDIVKITLTITDEDLSCGTAAEWGLNSGGSIGYRQDYSAETFEVRIDGEPVLLTEINGYAYVSPVGSFGVNLLGGNMGEITFDWNSSEYNPGEYDLNITLFDSDGYYESNNGPFIVEEYGSQITTTVHLIKEGSICADMTGDGNIYVDDLTYLVAYLFTQGPAPNPLWIGNVDGIINNGTPIDVADLTYLVDYLFNQGPAPTC